MQKVSKVFSVKSEKMSKRKSEKMIFLQKKNQKCKHCVCKYVCKCMWKMCVCKCVYHVAQNENKRNWLTNSKTFREYLKKKNRNLLRDLLIQKTIGPQKKCSGYRFSPWWSCLFSAVLRDTTYTRVSRTTCTSVPPRASTKLCPCQEKLTVFRVT